ncbi:hypothetical protein RJ40_04725 [Methanofollis aquaemaris]|uniref:Uncharacterized protein n=1 Tax=Methanofollis aquaemaris TaxID=126734 RepID=A0A8A3S5E0_9EURY|nr:hypothetical protein [Methanofollis aquaemaris]QSZ66846.1 hypothetical protein RJ40_04725 [Methanofollis aquaemaris]
MVNHEGAPISLVFSEGTCILAEYQDLQGARAWDAVRGLADDPVEAALYLLNGPQIRLAAEFNAKASVPRSDMCSSQEKPRNRQKSEPGPAKGKNASLQVPRGCLIEIKRNATGLEMLDGLKHSGFTGYAIFNLGSDSFTLVFSGGVCILAGGERERGASALVKVGEMTAPGEVAVYSLTDPQLALAREFNQGCLVEGGEEQPPSPPVPPTRRREVGAAPEPLSPAGKDLTRGSGAGKHLERERHVRAPAEVPHEDPVFRDLAALDGIDADQMAADLKDSYVSILDRLELGHLIGENKEKGVK